MTPHKNSEGGSFMTDRRFRGIGRVHRASGITRAATFKLFDAGLTELAKDSAGRDWLRMYQRLEIDGVDLWGKMKIGACGKAPQPGTGGSLVDALIKWREDKKGEVAPATYVGRKHLITQVKAAARAGATIDELPAVFRKVKTRMKDAPVSFNLIRNYLRAFIRDTLGPRHELYQMLKYDIGPIKIPGHAKKKERKRHPLTPAQVLLLASSFRRKHQGGGETEGTDGHGDVVIAMALTGTHPKEYFLDGITEHATHVHVHGEKRGGRDRIVPKLYPSKLWPSMVLQRPRVNMKTFARDFRSARRAAKLTCTPLDLRRSFATWMEAAGIERTRRRQYMGHNPKDVTDLYETQELLQHIAEDSATLVAWIDRELEHRPHLVLEAKA